MIFGRTNPNAVRPTTPVKNIGTGAVRPTPVGTPLAAQAAADKAGIMTKPVGGIGAGAGFNNPQATANFAGIKNMISGTPAPKGGMMKKGGTVSASSRADGIAQRGKTRGKIV